MAANKLRYCPECAIEVPADARVCPDCGHVLAKSVSGVVLVVIAIALACALLVALWATSTGPPVDPGL
jgi:predicted nucleic acid-binding Zn ribbon protein